MSNSNYFKTRRLQLNLTQRQVAAEMGLSVPAVAAWESGISCPDVKHWDRLSTLLKTSPARIAEEVLKDARAKNAEPSAA